MKVERFKSKSEFGPRLRISSATANSPFQYPKSYGHAVASTRCLQMAASGPL